MVFPCGKRHGDIKAQLGTIISGTHNQELLVPVLSGTDREPPIPLRTIWHVTSITPISLGWAGHHVIGWTAPGCWDCWAFRRKKNQLYLALLNRCSHDLNSLRMISFVMQSMTRSLNLSLVKTLLLGPSRVLSSFREWPTSAAYQVSDKVSSLENNEKGHGLWGPADAGAAQNSFRTWSCLSIALDVIDSSLT